MIIIGVTVTYPAVDDFLSTSRFWNGLADINKHMNVTRLKELTDISEYYSKWSNSTLFIIGPGLPFTDEDVNQIENYLWQGGRLFIADDFGTGNMLLEGLGIKVRFSDKLLLDPLFRIENSSFPVIMNNSFGYELVFNYGTVLENASQGKVLAWSTHFSYLTDNYHNTQDNTISGPFPVYLKLNHGNGEIHVLSDSSPFINRMLGEGDNRLFLQQANKGFMILDESHFKETRLTRFKNGLFFAYSLLQRPYIRFSVVVITTLLILSLDLSEEKYINEVDEVGETMKKHPEWSQELLKFLYEIRRKTSNESREKSK
jgi:hypothetical protein